MLPSVVSWINRFGKRAGDWVERPGSIQIVGALVIGIVVLVTYYPALQIGFWFDDYFHLETAGRPPWSEFLTSAFDPRVQNIWYRPIQQMQWRVEYMVLGGDALGYHVVQNLFHLLNCLLLYTLIVRLTRNWSAGFIGVLTFSVLPVYSLSVFWLAVPDPLTGTFYLLAIWLWIDYLENSSWTSYGLTFVAFVTALLSKEVALTLPITLLLVDRWLLAKPTRWKHWASRISPFFLFLPVWALLEWNILVDKLAQESSGSIWNHLFSYTLYYVGALSFPWEIDSPIRYLTLPAVLGVTLYAAATRKRWLLFLGTVGLVSLIPMLGPAGSVGQRYLYLPLMASAAGVGVLVAWLYSLVSRRLPSFRLAALGAFALVITLVPMRDSLTTAEAAEFFSTFARQTRLQFRPIYQQHSTFGPDTLLYFVEPPSVSYNISGLMFLHYGANVSAAGTDNDRRAELRQHSNAYVFYLDEQNIFREQRVNSTANAIVNPNLPAQFGDALSLEGFEVVDTQVKPGEAIILILYWRTLKAMDRDYTVFAHVLDDHDNVLASYDGPPRRGASPTSSWRPGSLNVDAVIVPIGSDVPSGQNYRIEVGMYFQPTMERLPVTSPSETTESDKVVFGSFRVEPAQ